MKNLSYIAGEITKGKNLDDNLIKYGTGMQSLYNGLAHMKLSMNYYTVVSMINEGEIKDDKFLDSFKEFNLILSEVLKAEEGNYDSELIDRIHNLRNSIIGIMEVVTEFVDRLRIYEYVLNRVEFKFSDKKFDYDYYNTYMTNDIMHYIFADKDNVAINSKISEIVGQLPVRMSKAKFYEHIKDAFTLYHGAQRKTIDDFYYTLSTNAMLKTSEGFNTMFPEVYKIYEILKNADYRNIDEQQYDALRNELDIAAGNMTDIADAYVLLIQMVNDIYTILLSDMTVGTVSETELSKIIINDVMDCFKSGENIEPIAEKFTAFEGKQEHILEIIMSSDFATQFVLANYGDTLKEQSLEECYSHLNIISKLQSGSDFVDIEEDGDASQDIPEDTYADSVADKLINELEELFNDENQMIRRAVMASVLSNIPVFFNNTQEIQEYINNSLISCTDEAEKKAVVEIIKMIVK
ncbi:MAG: hypothetical protein ACI4D4_11205 [Lachnospira sp.]